MMKPTPLILVISLFPSDVRACLAHAFVIPQESNMEGDEWQLNGAENEDFYCWVDLKTKNPKKQ